MSSSSKHVPRIILTTVVVTALALAAFAAKPGPGSDGAANKVAASGSATEVAGPNEEIELLSASVKLSSPEDLMLSVSLECSITTELTTVGDDTANASGSLDVWIEIDGFKVPVSTNDTTNPGEVTFCNRTYERTTSMFDDEDATIRTFIGTRTSHGFNWLALDELWATADDNIHDIVVKGRLTQETTGDATATVAVGKRTLIIEPTKVANGETVEIS